MCILTQFQLNTLARTAKRENDPTKEQFNVKKKIIHLNMYLKITFKAIQATSYLKKQKL
jgi:hypothetical protein